jgi:biopolymer transport protein ExbB
MDIVELLKHAFIQSGAGWVLWLLFFLSVGTIAVAIERFLYFRRKGDDLAGLIEILDGHLRYEERVNALAAVERSRTFGGMVAAAGLRLADRGARAAEKGMESVMAIERKGLERRLAYLGTLGNNAPFIGLFGTVIGVVLAFEALGQASGTAGVGGAGQTASAEVMSAIAEALVATAVGIGVALPAVALYNYFQRRIADMLADAEALSSLVVAYLVDQNAPLAGTHRPAAWEGDRHQAVRQEGMASPPATTPTPAASEAP